MYAFFGGNGERCGGIMKISPQTPLVLTHAVLTRMDAFVMQLSIKYTEYIDKVKIHTQKIGKNTDELFTWRH